MQIDHVHFYLNNARQWRDWFIHTLGFQPVASGTNCNTRTEVVKSGSVYFALSSPLTPDSIVAQFLQRHPTGVADVAFGVEDLETAMEVAIARGVKVLQPIQQYRGVKWGKIAAWGTLDHTLIERTISSLPLPPGMNWERIERDLDSKEAITVTDIDHLVINLPAGELERAASWYENSLGFCRQQAFTIETQHSGLHSQVMVHPASGVQLPLNEPASANSQIQEFLEINRGAGVQHIALKTGNILQFVPQCTAAGLNFLSVPSSYYTQVQQRCQGYLPVAELEEIARSQILVDAPDLTSPGLLLQIFTQPIFEGAAFFLEIIERRCLVRGFGEGNFRTLFQAMEKEQMNRGGFERL